MADLIDRQAAIKAIENLQDCYNGFSDAYDKACIIGVLEEIPTAQVNTPTDTPTDTISRQAAIDFIDAGRLCNPNEPRWSDNEIVNFLKSRPSAQPEYRMDEWCTDCKEYDYERHCCPRFNHVIRTTLQEVQAEQSKIIRCKDCLLHGVCRFEQGLGLDGYCSQAERRAE